MNFSISDAFRIAPECSNGVAGTHDGNMRNTERGIFSDALSMYSIPSSPVTLHISWGSAITVVVPIGMTASENSDGERCELSIWQWASMKPGMRYFPPASISCFAFIPSPNPAIRPLIIYTSDTNVFLLNTSMMFALRITVSHSTLPIAASMRREAVFLSMKSLLYSG